MDQSDVVIKGFNGRCEMDPTTTVIKVNED